VLFIGNSLTRANDLPATVRAMATAEGLEWYVQAQLLAVPAWKTIGRMAPPWPESRAGTGML